MEEEDQCNFVKVLLELKIGKAKVLICAFNMLGLNENEPSTVAMTKFIKTYMKSSDFNPYSEIKIEDFKAFKSNFKKNKNIKIASKLWRIKEN